MTVSLFFLLETIFLYYLVDTVAYLCWWGGGAGVLERLLLEKKNCWTPRKS